MRVHEREAYDAALDGRGGVLICEACGGRCDVLYTAFGVDVCGQACARDVAKDIAIDERIDDARDVA